MRIFDAPGHFLSVHDRRTLDRTFVHDRIKLLTQEGAEVEAEIVDHSSQGARVLVEKPIQLGTVVRLVVGSDQFSGLVRYCTREDGRGKYTVGVRLE